MSVSDTEKSLRRRILFSSIQDGTPEDVIQKAIDLLDNEYGSKPEIRYTELVKRLREAIDHPAFGHGNLLGRIMMVRNKPMEQIGPDPANSMDRATPTQNRGKPRSAPPVVKLTGRDLVFNTLLGHVTAMVAKRSSASLQSYRTRFVGQALSLKLSKDCVTKLVSWARSESLMSSITGSNEELHKIINTAFVWLCEEFGPVDADKMLLQAVAMTERLPEAFEFSPRDFL